MSMSCTRTLRLAGAWLLSVLTVLCCAPHVRAEPLPPADQVAITQTVTGVGLYSDLREWDRVLALLGDHVTTDYVSVFGGEVETTTRTDLVEQWRNTLQGFDATQHQITNVAVQGSADSATTRSHIRATHRIGDRLWILGGVYTHQLVRSPAGWQVTSMSIHQLYEEGNRALLQEAVQRSSE
jgi:hypothetical protein